MENFKPNKDENKQKKLIFIASLVLLLIVASYFYINRTGFNIKNIQIKNEADQESPQATDQNKTNGIETVGKGDSESYLLNFIDRRLKIDGYPFANKGYSPKLFSILFVVPSFEEFDYQQNLTDPKKDWVGTYVLYKKENKIFIPIGRSASKKPIWQIMEIVPAQKFAEFEKKCPGSKYDAGGLEVTSHKCSQAEIKKEKLAGTACSFKLADGNFLLYEQHSEDASVKGNMCEVLKNNSIEKISSIGYN